MLMAVITLMPLRHCHYCIFAAAIAEAASSAFFSQRHAAICSCRH